MKKYLIIACLFLTGMSALPAQTNFWEKIPGPPGGELNIIPTNKPDTLYARYAKTDEIYRSTDNGLNWSRVSIDKSIQVAYYGNLVIGPSGKFYYLISAPPHVYSTLWVSTDEGANWQLVGNSLYQICQIIETSSGALIGSSSASVSPGAIYRSPDGGHTWSQVLPLPIPEDHASVRQFPNGDLILTSESAPGKLAVYHSATDGLTWSKLPIPLTGPKLISITHTGVMFANLEGYVLFLRSLDAGTTWDTIPASAFGKPYIPDIRSMTSTPSGRVFAQEDGSKLYYSDDNGNSWYTVPSNTTLSALSLNSTLPDGALLGLSNGSIYRSADSGQHWTFSTYGVEHSKIDQLEIMAPDTTFAKTPDGLWRKAGSAPWEIRSTPIQQLIAGNRQLAIVQGNAAYLSGDFGNSFSPLACPGVLLGMSPGDSLLFATGPGGGTYRSADRGISWQNVLPYHQLNLLAFHPSGRFYASLFDSDLSQDQLWYSDNFGLSWSQLTGLPADFRFNGAIHITSPSGTICIYGSFPEARTLLSSDNGLSWHDRPKAELNYFGQPYFVENALGHFWIADNDGSVYSSIDQQVSWQRMPNVADEFPDVPLTTLYARVYRLGRDQQFYLCLEKNGLYRTRTATSQGAYLKGHVRKDADADCSTPDAQTPVANWVVEAKGNYTVYTTTNADGGYQFFVDTGAYTVSARPPQANWWAICDSTHTIALDSVYESRTLDFAAVALVDCPLVTVDLTIPRLRRCFDNPVYVHFCNQGSETADSAWVDVMLDSYLTLVQSDQPHSSLGNNIYRFYAGNIIPGQCGDFTLTVHVDCDSTSIGQTHCITAHGYPDTLCTAIPGWSGAEIQASVSCQDTLVHFDLRNTGAAASQLLNYRIIEDNEVLIQGNKTYQPGQDFAFDVPANGHTWRIESEQEPGHPFSNKALAFSEGCGGFESLGFINQFSVDAFTPSWDQDCVQNTSSYDPNDKQGFPLGTGDEHLIRPGQDLEYLIRFQNTGTDTAFTVVVRDTLSPWLDPASVRPGASSHPYSWSLSGQGVLSFTFSNVLLPDSTVDEAASHGFISFRIAQQPEAPLGAVIYNEANIYFDFNEPVVTNRTWHTVGVPVVTGLFQAPVQPAPSEILVSPQPVGTYTVMKRANGEPFRNDHFYLLDALGHVVREAGLNGSTYRFERLDLPSGLYFYRIVTADGRLVGSGRLL